MKNTRQANPTPTAEPPARSSMTRRAFLLGGLAAGGFGAAYGVTWYVSRGRHDGMKWIPQDPHHGTQKGGDSRGRHDGMKWIPPGEFTMGSADPKLPRVEHPAHRVRLDGFWMDETEVTNAAYEKFVKATRYVTVAEKPPDWEQMKLMLPPDTPKPPPDILVPGSLVFTPPPGPVPLGNPSAWWRYVPGANWRHPEGPESNLTGRENHPVVHVAWDDAVAYAKWAKKRLPTEAEWEYAARGGKEGYKFIWGDTPPADDAGLANIWHGEFPHRNTKADGWDRTAPVKSYAPNGYGLYDMAGNVWEWCADWYRPDEYVRRKSPGVVVNPPGPNEIWDPAHPNEPRRVTRGGSFLCHVTYCESYRPAARRGTESDTGHSHVGFRCVVSG